MKKVNKPRAMIGDTPVWCAHDNIINCAELIPNPKNPNTHPEKQIELLGKIITSQGWRMPITVSKRSGFIVKGHGRLEAAIKAGINQAPVDYQDYKNEAVEYADLIADNRLAEIAEIDNSKMAELIAELDEFDIELTGFTEDEIETIFPSPEKIQQPGSGNDSIVIRLEIISTTWAEYSEIILNKIKDMETNYKGFKSQVKE